MNATAAKLEYVKAEPISLKSHPDFSEVWLHEQILKDTSILGLGELDVLNRERVQVGAGRLDMLLTDSDPDSPTRYEVEIMLGPMFRFSVKWRGERSPLVSIAPLWGGDFQGIRVYRSDSILGRARNVNSAPQNIVSMSPPNYPSAWLHPCRARFRFTWQIQCISLG